MLQTCWPVWRILDNMLCATQRACAFQSARSSARSARKNLPPRVSISRAASKDVVIPEPSFAIPGVLLATAAFSAYEGVTALAAVTGILGLFLAVQATRVKFIFGPDALEVVIGEQQERSENAFVGGENKWKYKTFTNWEFWWPGFPVLVYFKETQTKSDGQIHFFPVIFNGKQVYDTMLQRCGPTQTSGPKS